MNHIKILVLILPLLLVGCGSNPKKRTYMGYEVFDKEYMVSGGETVTLPTTKAGPIPAETENYKIEVAGILTGPSKTHSNESVLIFSFSFTNKSSKILNRVVVEQVSPAKNSLKLVGDNKPEIINKTWSGSTKPIIINQRNLPWFYEKGATNFVFKFTIEDTNGNKSVLYQPSSFFEQAKQALINHHN